MAQQQKSGGSDSKDVLEKAEAQAETMSELLVQGRELTEPLVSVKYNTVQRMPDYTEPSELATKKFLYSVYVTEDGPVEEFNKMVKDQIYRGNRSVNINTTKGKLFKKGSTSTVSVEIATFIDGLLSGEKEETLKLLENRKYLLYAYFKDKYLTPHGYTYMLIYPDLEIKDDASVRTGQDNLKKDLIEVLKSGKSLTTQNVHIHSYQRSYFRRGYHHDPKEVEFKSTTNRQTAAWVRDEIVRFMPLPGKNDIIEFIFHRLPQTNEYSGFGMRYFYFDETNAKYIPSEEEPLISFDPYKIIDGKINLSGDGKTTSISYTTKPFTKLGDGVKTDFTIEVIGRQGNHIKINEISEFSTVEHKYFIAPNQLVQESNGIQPFRTDSYRNQAQVYNEKEHANAFLDAQLREKRFYSNQRDRNAVKRLTQLSDYYGDNNTFEKVQTDYNSFFSTASADQIKLLESNTQFTFITLLHRLETIDDPTLEDFISMYSSMQSLWNVSSDLTETTYENPEKFKEALAKRKLALEEQAKIEEAKMQENHATDLSKQTHGDIVINTNTSNGYSLWYESELIGAFINYLDDPKGYKSQMISIVHSQLSRAIVMRSFDLSEERNDINLIQRAVAEKDEKKQLALLKEILEEFDGINDYNAKWRIALRDSKSLSEFRVNLQQAPSPYMIMFFEQVLDGSLTTGLEQEEERLNGLIKEVNNSEALKQPLMRLNNSIGNFIASKGIETKDLHRINAVFYPGVEGFYTEAKMFDPVPVNLYYYDKNNERNIVLFVDSVEIEARRGKKEQKSVVKVKEFNGDIDSDEILSDGVLGYIDQAKVLGKGILYYQDAKKFEGEESYTNTFSSYEFVQELSTWETAVNYVSGAVTLLSLFAGPAGWARNAWAARGLLALNAVAISPLIYNKWQKYWYDDDGLGTKDWFDITFAVGGLIFDGARIAIPNSERLARAQNLWSVADMVYNAYDIQHDGLKLNDAYSILHLLFTLGGMHRSGELYNQPFVNYKKFRTKPGRIESQLRSGETKVPEAMHNSKVLGQDGVAIESTEEFYKILGFFGEKQIKNIKTNLHALKQSDQKAYESFLAQFGKGKKNEYIKHYLLLEKMANNTSIPNLRSLVDEAAPGYNKPSKGETETTIHQKGEAVITAKDDLKKVETKTQQLEERVTRTNELIKQRENNVKDLKNEIGDLEINVESSKQAIDFYNETVTKRKTTISNSEQRQKAFAKQVNELESNQLADVKKKLETNAYNIENAKSDLESKKEAIEREIETQGKLDKNIAAGEIELEKMKRQSTRLKKESAAGYEAIDKIKEQKLEVDARVNNAKTRSSESEERLNQVKKENEELNNQIRAIEEEIASLKAEIGRVKDEIKQTHTDPEVQNEKLLENEELQGLNASLNTARKDLESSQKISEAKKEKQIRFEEDFKSKEEYRKEQIAEKERLDKAILNQENRLVEIESELEKNKTSYNALEGEVNTFKNNYTTSEESVTQLSNEVNSIKKNINSLEEERTNLYLEKSNYEVQIAQKNNSIENEKNLRQNVQNQINDLNIKIGNEQTNVRQSEARIKGKKEQIKKEEGIQEALKEDKAKDLKELDGYAEPSENVFVTKSEDEIRASEARVAKYEKSVENAESKIKQLDTQIKQQKEVIVNSSDQQIAIGTKISKVQSDKINVVEGKINDLNDKIQTSKENIEIYEGKIAKERDLQKDLKTKVTNKQIELDGHREKATEITKDINLTSQKINETQTKLNAVGTKIGALEISGKNSAASKVQLEQENNGIKKDIDQLKAEVQELENSANALKNDNQNADSKEKDNQEELNRISEELEVKNAQLTELDKKHAANKERIDEYNTEILDNRKVLIERKNEQSGLIETQLKQNNDLRKLKIEQKSHDQLVIDTERDLKNLQTSQNNSVNNVQDYQQKINTEKDAITRSNEEKLSLNEELTTHKEELATLNEQQRKEKVHWQTSKEKLSKLETERGNTVMKAKWIKGRVRSTKSSIESQKRTVNTVKRNDENAGVGKEKQTYTEVEKQKAYVKKTINEYNDYLKEVLTRETKLNGLDKLLLIFKNLKRYQVNRTIQKGVKEDKTKIQIDEDYRVAVTETKEQILNLLKDAKQKRLSIASSLQNEVKEDIDERISELETKKSTEMSEMEQSELLQLKGKASILKSTDPMDFADWILNQRNTENLEFESWRQQIIARFQGYSVELANLSEITKTLSEMYLFVDKYYGKLIKM